MRTVYIASLDLRRWRRSSATWNEPCQTSTSARLFLRGNGNGNAGGSGLESLRCGRSDDVFRQWLDRGEPQGDQQREYQQHTDERGDTRPPRPAPRDAPG